MKRHGSMLAAALLVLSMAVAPIGCEGGCEPAGEPTTDPLQHDPTVQEQEQPAPPAPGLPQDEGIQDQGVQQEPPPAQPAPAPPLPQEPQQDTEPDW